MDKNKKASIEIELDASGMQKQLEELKDILSNFEFTSFEGGADHFFGLLLSNLSTMCDDIILSNGSFATMTDGSLKFIQCLNFGLKFELLTSALRADKSNLDIFDILTHT
ncbi:hypothetical protein A9255_02965 [Xenorhabdus hominickii]|uniref:Uncharacterized protein n=1 Tax=Xenorhabdus hominickii TaxID=351679 RepID=A0A2G0Q5V2_XENHO|nr:hypothetical protein [Xenorhabdus hominickii]AOM39644.1 hypothetical protein A9255_02965 [Xenorhabdus hominickii]PHM54571.1 hypothetical protein Xhom_02514 [Xenorhabdus hominickii]